MLSGHRPCGGVSLRGSCLGDNSRPPDPNWPYGPRIWTLARIWVFRSRAGAVDTLHPRGILGWPSEDSPPPKWHGSKLAGCMVRLHPASFSFDRSAPRALCARCTADIRASVIGENGGLQTSGPRRCVSTGGLFASQRLARTATHAPIENRPCRGEHGYGLLSVPPLVICQLLPL